MTTWTIQGSIYLRFFSYKYHSIAAQTAFHVAKTRDLRHGVRLHVGVTTYDSFARHIFVGCKEAAISQQIRSLWCLLWRTQKWAAKLSPFIII